MSNIHHVTFSDAITKPTAASRKLVAVPSLPVVTPLYRLKTEQDAGLLDNGKPVVTADLGPLEASVYESADGALVVQIDIDQNKSNGRTLRVYLNDSTLHDSSTAQ